MARKKAESISKDVVDIRKLIDDKKLVIGTEIVIKKLKAGKISKVFLTSNCPNEVRDDIERYSAIAKAEVVQLDIPNDELGIICKKPFSISIVGSVKE